MEDDDIRQLLHATYTIDGVEPTMLPGGLEHRSREPRHRRLLTSLIAAVVAVVVAVPIGVTVLLRSGVGGGSHAATTSVLDLHMFTATTGWAWAGGSQILHTSSGVAHWTIVPPPVGDFVIVGVAWAGSESARILAAPASSLNNLDLQANGIARENLWNIFAQLLIFDSRQ